MAHVSEWIEKDIEKYLQSHQHKDLLRFITCGSVDDGKSTLIGRLLYDSKMIFEDQLKALASDSQKMGTQGQNLDFALLVDGLAAEREQGITIDVAYRFFSTSQRKFIVADTPGHEQYTRNMVTGASTADLAIVLVDARKGLLTQTRRHTYLASLVGIQHVVLAINKMDLVAYSQATFDAIVSEYLPWAHQLGIEKVTPIPMSALNGENINTVSPQMGWYSGPTLMHFLETVPLETLRSRAQKFRLPVQWVNRPDASFRGYAGTIASGVLKTGDSVRILPSSQEAIVQRIVTHGAELKAATAGQAVTLTLDRDIDISRGDIITLSAEPATVSSQFQAKLVWMSAQTLYPGRQYTLKSSVQTCNCSVIDIKHTINVNTLDKLATKYLNLNDVATVNIDCDKPLVFDAYTENNTTGAFILIDKITHDTVGAGMIEHPLRRAQNVHLQHYSINKQKRAAQNLQTPRVLWFTGLSGSGKSSIANALEQQLFALGKRTYILDGDNVRHGLNKDLGFTAQDRIENIRRVAEVAKLMVDAGLIVITTFISPFREDRAYARSIFETGEFLEIFVDTPLALCEQRDPKGLYKKARQGEIKNFTGLDSPYEPPLQPDIHLRTEQQSVDDCVNTLVNILGL